MLSSGGYEGRLLFSFTRLKLGVQPICMFTPVITALESGFGRSSWCRTVVGLGRGLMIHGLVGLTSLTLL